jgi:hypothetical protein
MIATLRCIFLAGLLFPAASAAQPASPQVACLEAADARTLLTGNDQERLCASTRSATGPVRCYEAGTDETTLGNAQLIRLCRCARDAAPVACFETATAETDVFDDRAIERCRPIEVQGLRPDCTPRPR